jgi:6-phosphogluconolactonase
MTIAKNIYFYSTLLVLLLAFFSNIEYLIIIIIARDDAKMTSNVNVSESVAETIVSMCNHLISAIETVGKESDRAITIGLSGGSLIQQLSAELPNHLTRLAPYTARLRFFFCDERYVPLDHTDSTCFGFLSEQFFQKLGVDPESAVLKINPNLSLDECAEDYARRLSEVLNHATHGFDILLLGIGPDGHTCSLFPGHKSFSDCHDSETRQKLVIAVRDSPKPPPQRVTLTLDYINNSRFLYFVAVGENKSGILKTIVVDKDMSIPSANVKPARPENTLIWFLDKPAASQIN